MAQKSLRSFIFSPEFEEGVSRAIEKAVAESDAAGLQPAYEPAFSQLRTLERMAGSKNGLDLEFHRAVAELLYQPEQPGNWLKRQAFRLLQSWEDSKSCDSSYIVRWREWLDLPSELGKAEILREDDLGTSMRRNSPFIFLAPEKAGPKGETKYV